MPRGLAIKLFGVPGDRLPGSEADTTQDFILVNGPAFAAPTPKAFLANLKMLAKTTDVGEGLKKGLSAVMQTVDAALETVGIQSPTIQTLGGAPNTHPLGETYYTQVPLRHGGYIAKLSIAPVSTNLTELAGSKVDTSGRPDALREDMAEVLIEQDSVWELRVQLCTDLEKMPVEDSSVVWDEKQSPYVAVARLTVPAQLGWERGLSEQQEQAVSFSPWHGLCRPSADRRRQPGPQTDLRDVDAVPRPAQRLPGPRASGTRRPPDEGHDDRLSAGLALDHGPAPRHHDVVKIAQVSEGSSKLRLIADDRIAITQAANTQSPR